MDEKKNAVSAQQYFIPKQKTTQHTTTKKTHRTQFKTQTKQHTTLHDKKMRTIKQTAN